MMKKTLKELRSNEPADSQGVRELVFRPVQRTPEQQEEYDEWARQFNKACDAEDFIDELVERSREALRGLARDD